MSTPPESAASVGPPAPATSPLGVLGNMSAFDPKTDNVSTYLERLQLYFEANRVEDDRKVAVLLTVVGAQTYDTLRSLLAPTSPRDKSYEELLEVLRKHYDPQPLLVAERFRFYKRSQRTDESISDFLADLRRLSIKCEFGDFLDQALRDRFVCGIRSDAIQKKLLAEPKLTVKRAQEIAQGMETADKDVKDLKQSGDIVATRTTENAVCRATASSDHGREKKTCYRCGRRHDENSCKFKTAKCHRCGKSGHIAPVCRSVSPPPRTPGPKRSYQYRKRKKGGTKWVDTDPDLDEPVPLLSLQSEVPQPPILVDLRVDETPVEFELDTGAAMTVIGEPAFRRMFPEAVLQKSSVSLKTYTGEKMKTVGEIEVKVSYQNQEPKSLSLVVVQGSGPALLGRNWLQHFVLDWSRIKMVVREKNALQQLLGTFADVFKEELGTITPGKAKLVVTASATPKFHRPRPVPYALHLFVERIGSSRASRSTGAC